MSNCIYIPGNVPSSKNSRQWTGKYSVMSKTCSRYVRATKEDYLVNKRNFQEMIKDLPKPYKIEFYFIRDSKRKFDYINPCQTIQDLMVKYGWLDDDNCDCIIPSFGGYHVDKTNAGVNITILS